MKKDLSISFETKGDFSKTNNFLQKVLSIVKLDKASEYGRLGVELLKQATPKDSGKTSESWEYEVKRSSDQIEIVFNNTNINDGVNIAIILDYGHGTGTGGWVVGQNYINPTIQPLFKKLANEAWEEVKKA